MYSKVCVLLLAIVLSQAKSEGDFPDNHLLSFVINAKGISHNNPERSFSCFDYYLPVLRDLGDQFKVDYHNCLEDSKLAHQMLDSSTESVRTEFNEAAKDACVALTSCSQRSDSIEFFECYKDAGNEGSKSLYAISANATEMLVAVQETCRTIDIGEKSCTSKAERVHTERTAETYEELNKCLAGVLSIPIPNSIPKTTPAPSPETTTPESTGSAPDDL